MKSFKSFFQKLAFIAFVFFSSANFLFAQSQTSFTQSTTDVKIRFVGAEEDLLIFEVQLTNLPTKGSDLVIMDENGNIIFEERIATVSHTCRYKIVRNNMELITFKISGKTFLFNQSFAISYKVEEKLEVKKVK